MCGIAGIVGNIERHTAEAAVNAMLDVLRRRGPDDHGVWHNGDVVTLGHRRLAIFDPSPAGHQPMHDASGRCTIVFNGAIYNFTTLRSQIRRTGHTFRSETDTEVLLEGYLAWGIDGLLARIDGMFSFALWDRASRELTLARDRLGQKPLCYVQDSQSLAFAPTPRALHGGGRCYGLDLGAIAAFLEYGYVPEDRCAYHGVTKVPAGTYMVWRDGELTSQRYWSPSWRQPQIRQSFEAAVDETEELFLEAVKRRLAADVPVAALLSGGIDSGLVCWAIKKLGGAVTAYTVSTPGDASDETQAAVATAQELGLSHRVVPMGDRDASIEEVVSAYGEPFACQSALGMLSVSHAIRQTGANVVLTGDGGDDLFLGYPRHRMLARLQRAARLIPPGAGAFGRMLRPGVPPRGAFKRGRHMIDYLVGGLPAYLQANDGLPGFAALGYLGPALAGMSIPERQHRWSRASATNLLAEYLEHDYGHQFVAEYLTKIDGATMWHGLEARSPFLDLALWEYAGRVPYSVRMHRGRHKAILRRIAERRIGRRIATEAKRGFMIPVENWLSSRGWPRLKQYFLESRLVELGLASAASILATIEHRALTHRIWYLWVLEGWLRSHGDSSPGLRPVA